MADISNWVTFASLICNEMFALLLLLFSAVCAEISGPYYHDEVGIPTAEAIWKSEVHRQVWRGTYNTRIIGGLPSVMGEHPYFVRPNLLNLIIFKVRIKLSQIIYE